jgi:hypothetical protein
MASSAVIILAKCEVEIVYAKFLGSQKEKPQSLVQKTVAVLNAHALNFMEK